MNRRAFVRTASGLLVPAIAARGNLIIGRRGGGAPTLQDSNTDAATGDEGIIEGNAQDWWGQKFTAGGNYTLTEFHVWLSKSGSPTTVLTPHIFSHDSGNDSPNSSLDSGNTINASALSASETEETFDGLSVSISSGTVYWVVLTGSPLAGNREILWHYNGNATSGESRMIDNNGTGVWTTFDTTTGFKYATYGN